MAMGRFFAAVPAVTAVVGFYFIDRNYIKVRKIACIVLYQILGHLKVRKAMYCFM